MFKRIIIHVTGFTQNLGYRTGTEILFVENQRKYASSDCYVMFPVRWKHSPHLIAEFVRRNVNHQGRIDCVCYSYGGGVWYPKFESLMERAGREIHTVNLIDPVPRLGRANIWKRVTGNYLVNVRNAKNCNLYLQKKDYPRSPGVAFYGDSHNYSVLDLSDAVGHSGIDNDSVVHGGIVKSLDDQS